MSPTVLYDSSAQDTDAYAILAEAWFEMVMDDCVPEGKGTPPITDKTEVVYAVSAEADVVGVLAFHREPGRFAVPLIYTEDSSRRAGVAQAMIRYLYRIATFKTDKVVLQIPTNKIFLTKFLHYAPSGLDVGVEWVET